VGGGDVDGRLDEVGDALVEAAKRRSVADLGAPADGRTDVGGTPGDQPGRPGSGGRPGDQPGNRRNDRWDLPADVVRSLCRSTRAAEIDRYGLRVRNAHVTGCLDLRAMSVPFALEFAGCEFDEPPVVEGADLHSLAFVAGTQLPGLLANGVRIRRDLDFSGSEVTGALTTTASTSRTAAIWLTEAEVGGRLLGVGTRIHGPADRAIQADRTRFGSNIRLIHGFSTDGELRLLAIRLEGSLDLTGARLVPKNDRALDMAESHVGGSIFIIDDEAFQDSRGRRPEIRGRVELGHTTVGGRVLVRNTTFVGPAVGAGGHHYLPGGVMRRCALKAPRLSIVGDLEISGTCRIEGGLDLTAADVKGAVVLDGQVVQNPGDRSVDLTNASVGGDLSAANLRSQGAFYLAGAHIHGSVRLAGAYLSHPVRVAGPAAERAPDVLLEASGVHIDRDLDMTGLVTRGGELWFGDARLGALVDLAGARLLCTNGVAVTFHQATVGGTLRFIDGFRSKGLLGFARARIGGRLAFDDSTLLWRGRDKPIFNPHGLAVEAIGTTVEGGIVLGWRRIDGGVDLTDATTTYLADDPARWGDPMRITGFTYDRFAALRSDPLGSNGNWDVPDRVRWLAGQESLDPGPFEQAARVYRAHGRTVDAEDILIRGKRLLRQRGATRGSAGRVRYGLSRSWNWVLDRAVGYGYRTGRAIGLLVVLVAVTAAALLVPSVRDSMRATDAVGVAYMPDGPIPGSGPAVDGRSGAGAVPNDDDCGDGRVRCFQPLAFSVDTVVPIIDLGQRSAWYPSHHDGAGRVYELWLNFATVMGWAISTVFALSFTRLARNA